jgi:hypothetical protein
VRTVTTLRAGDGLWLHHLEADEGRSQPCGGSVLHAAERSGGGEWAKPRAGACVPTQSTAEKDPVFRAAPNVLDGPSPNLRLWILAEARGVHGSARWLRPLVSPIHRPVTAVRLRHLSKSQNFSSIGTARNTTDRASSGFIVCWISPGPVYARSPVTTRRISALAVMAAFAD